MSKDYLDPKQPIGIEPSADRNVEAVGPCCLDVNIKSAYLMKGRGGGLWWMIWLIFFCIVGTVLLNVYGSLSERITFKEFIAGLVVIPVVIVPTTIIFGLSTLWPIHTWRTHLPMRFNRCTRKVYFYFYRKGTVFTTDWDNIRAYLKLQKGVTPQGVPLADPQVNIDFEDERGRTGTVALMGTQKAGLGRMEGAAALWEYIRVYMEEGPEKLPAPEPWMRDLNSLEEIRKENNPFPIHTKHWWLWPFEIEVFFPVRLVWFAIAYPTDILYYHLAKRIKVNPFPPEMEEPCRCKENEGQ